MGIINYLSMMNIYGVNEFMLKIQTNFGDDLASWKSYPVQSSLRKKQKKLFSKDYE